MTKLQLAKTIRTARIDELPASIDNLKLIEESKKAKIVEGFILKPNTTEELPFDFFCEINIDNSKLWKLFKDFLITFPKEISFIYGHIDSEPNYSKYVDKFEVLNDIEKFEIELSQDGFLEWGIIYHDENILKEIFIKKTKYIQFWGVDKDEFLKIMEKNSIKEIKDMKFIDEYPLVTEALRLHHSETVETSELIAHFENIFT